MTIDYYFSYCCHHYDCNRFPCITLWIIPPTTDFPQIRARQPHHDDLLRLHSQQCQCDKNIVFVCPIFSLFRCLHSIAVRTAPMPPVKVWGFLPFDSLLSVFSRCMHFPMRQPLRMLKGKLDSTDPFDSVRLLLSGRQGAFLRQVRM
jgi:hypothetical protein